MLNHLFCRISTRYSYIPFFLSNSNKIQHNLSQYPPKQNHKRFSHTLINRHQKTETPSEIKRPVSPLTSKEHKSTSRRGTQRQIENILFIPAYERLPKTTTDYPHKIANFFPTSGEFSRPPAFPTPDRGRRSRRRHPPDGTMQKHTYTHRRQQKSRECERCVVSASRVGVPGSTPRRGLRCRYTDRGAPEDGGPSSPAPPARLSVAPRLEPAGDGLSAPLLSSAGRRCD